MNELELIYKKRKKQLLPLIFGLASFFVIFRIILPQWSDISDVKELITTKSSTVKAKEESIMVLDALSNDKVDNDYELATKALPLQKDIVLIYDQLNDVSGRTSVKLGGFSVKVGDVYSSITTKKGSNKNIGGVPFLNIIVSVSGKNEDVRSFAEELYKSVPLVEIKSIDVTKNDARYDVNFFYKPVVERPKNAESTPLEALTAEEERQLKTLESWSTGVFEQ